MLLLPDVSTPSWTRCSRCRRCRSRATSTIRSPWSRIRGTRGSSRSRPRSTCGPPASPPRRSGAPRRSSSSSTTSGSIRTRTRPTTTSTPKRGCGTRGGTAAVPTWATGRDTRRATSPSRPMDRLQDVRSKIMLALIKAGVPVEVQHHEVATAGQAEIDFKFGTLVQTADRLMAYKYVVKNVCHNLGYTATFMPKPLFGDNGSGMHVHQSLWKGDTPLFYDESGYALLSRDGPALHRRAHRSRACVAGPLRADNQQLPPPGPWLRGAGQPDVLGAEPLGDLPDSDVLEQPEGAAGRVPCARSDGQPVPRLLGPADGRPGRHPAEARAARADRRGPVRAARRAEGVASRWSRGRWRNRSPRSRRITSSCSRVTCSRPTCWTPGSR